MTHIDDYRANPAINYSSLKWMAISPLRYKHAKEQPYADTDSKRCGRLDHCAVLERYKVKDWPMWPGGDRTKKAKAEFGNVEDYIWKASELSAALDLSTAVQSHPVAGPLVSRPGVCEQPVYWTDARTGKRCKCRPDKRCGQRIIELKSTGLTLSERMIQRQIITYQYHVQAAWYLDGTGASEFSWIFVEQKAPHDVVVVHASEEWIEMGRATYRTWLDRLIECEGRGRFPGLSDEPLFVDVPKWMHDEDTGLGDLDDAITIGGE